MVYEARKQSMAWMETDTYALSMEDKMEVRAFGRARSDGCDGAQEHVETVIQI